MYLTVFLLHFRPLYSCCGTTGANAFRPLPEIVGHGR